MVSWSGRDYFGRWKALHYAARDAFAPALVSTHLNGDTVEVWTVAPERSGIRGTMTLELHDFQGTTLWEMPVPTEVLQGESVRVWAGGTGDLLGAADPATALFVADLRVEGAGPGGQSPPSSILYFVPPRDLALATPTIRLEWREEGGVKTLTLTSDVLAKDVYLTVEPSREDSSSPSGLHHLSDNFFDLLPGRTKVVEIRTSLPLETLQAGLRVRTLADVPGEGTPAEETPGTSLF